MSAIKNHFHDEICASDEPDFPEPWCLTCMDRGEVGGAVWQTAETFEWVTEPCPDCTKADANSLPVSQAGYERQRMNQEPAGEGKT